MKLYRKEHETTWGTLYFWFSRTKSDLQKRSKRLRRHLAVQKKNMSALRYSQVSVFDSLVSAGSAELKVQDEKFDRKI